MPDPVHIEATSKPIKLLQLVGVIILIGSAAAAAKYHREIGPRRLVLAASCGAGVWVLGRFLAWWKYG